MEGVVRFPSEFGITFGSPASITAMHELLVPKSIPIILLTVRDYADPMPAMR
jgi:hypothetical protein